ncbi:hypothetical protein ACF0H5_011513 [Mactra antiquata]
MADASLDDFFAKKDRSKKKSKSSKLTPDDIFAESDKPAKKDKKKKDREKSSNTSNSNSSGGTIGLPVKPEEEEEWKEVEEEKEKDYSGLRIANLQITEKEGEESEEGNIENDEDDDEDGDNKDKKDTTQQGPWKAGTAPPTTTNVISEPPPTKVEESVKEESKPNVGKYIPPSQRGAAASGSTGGSTPGPTVPAHLRKKKTAPNLKSEEDFPTLGGGPNPAQFDSDPRNFEKVQHGGRQMDDPTRTTQQLSLGNKFSALQD